MGVRVPTVGEQLLAFAAVGACSEQEERGQQREEGSGRTRSLESHSQAYSAPSSSLLGLGTGVQREGDGLQVGLWGHWLGPLAELVQPPSPPPPSRPKPIPASSVSLSQSAQGTNGDRTSQALTHLGLYDGAVQGAAVLVIEKAELEGTQGGCGEETAGGKEYVISHSTNTT